MDLQQAFDRLKQAHAEEPYPDIRTRQTILKRLLNLLQTHAEDFARAVSQDFSHRSKTETLFLELFPTIKALKYCTKHAKRWMKPRSRDVSWIFKPAYTYLYPQPLGVVGNMVPWNYPLYLALVPAAYALAAGNKVMIKMSELSPRTGALLEKLVNQEGLSSHLQIVNGDVEVSKAFSHLPFGHLIFTGSTPVGKMVMRAASENLTPVTLELGGKSPAVISASMNEKYFSRLFMGKLFNAGQTCIAPDYILIPKGWESKVSEKFKGFLDQHYPRLMNNKDYSSVISPEHKLRLLELVEDAKQKGAGVEVFGDLQAQGRKLPYYLIFNAQPSMRIMQEEIFGPIFPVVTYNHFSEVLQMINAMPNPLALYYFGENKEEIAQLKVKTLSGALTINETMMHIAIDDLPFGGVGYSGMGHYHSQEGFDAFSKLKPIFVQRRYAASAWLYPPYGRLMRLFLRLIPGIKVKDLS